MQNNWGVLILLVVAVLIYALVQSHKKPEDIGGDAETPEDEGQEKPEAPEEQPPEKDELPWEMRQKQLSEERPIEQSKAVEFPPAVEADGDASLAPEAEVGPVPQSRHAMNIAIRRKAWRLFRVNYRKILPLTAVVMLLTSLGEFLPELPGLAGWILQGWRGVGLLHLLILLVVYMGAAYAAVRLWKGEAPEARQLFHFYRGRLLLPVLGLVLLQLVFVALLQQALFTAMMLMPDGMSIALIQRLYLVADLLYYVVLIWLESCFRMVHLQLAWAPEWGAQVALKYGFRTGNRHFGRVLGMVVTVCWPFAIPLITLVFISYFGDWLYWVVRVLYLLLIVFYGGYCLLSIAGLADELLPESYDEPYGEGEPSDEAEPAGDGEPPCEDKPPESDPEGGEPGEAN